MRRIAARAPVRVCDAGGWTDTWFARRGVVCSIAVEPGANVAIEVDDGPGPLTLDVSLTGERYELPRGGPRPQRHPLLEAAVASCPPPAERRTSIRIGAAVPPGSGTGTSAAVVVALLCALHAARDETIDPDALARDAHAVEIGCGLQSGVQDQYAAAHGGCNTIVIDPYPHSSASRIALDADTRRALDARLFTVYLGRPHASSQVHEAVIARLDRQADELLQPLRDAAAAAAAALRAGDLEAYGAALAENTTAQAALHPQLVNADARRLIALGRQHGVTGWKVNGAGGDGGSVTLLASHDTGARTRLLEAIDRERRWRRLAFRLAGRGASAE